MLKELSHFTQSLDAELKGIGVEPREGLHIVLSPEELADGSFQILEQFDYEMYRKKKPGSSELQKNAQLGLVQHGWLIPTSALICQLRRFTRVRHSAWLSNMVHS